MRHDTHVKARGQLSKVSSPFTYVSPRIEFKSGLASCWPPPQLKFYFKNTVYNFSEYPLRLKHNCQALFSNSFFF